MRTARNTSPNPMLSLNVFDTNAIHAWCRKLPICPLCRKEEEEVVRNLYKSMQHEMVQLMENGVSFKVDEKEYNFIPTQVLIHSLLLIINYKRPYLNVVKGVLFSIFISSL